MYSTARLKLDTRKYILASANNFSPSSQQMLVSKRNMLSCMILLTIKFDARVQLLMRIMVQSVDAPGQDYMLLCIILLAIYTWCSRTLLIKHSLNACWEILIHEL